MEELTGKLTRWRLRLSEMKYDVVHRDVINHQALDALSWLETTDTDDIELDDEVTTFLVENGKAYQHEMCFECYCTVEKDHVLPSQQTVLCV